MHYNLKQTDWIFGHLDGGYQGVIKKWTIGVVLFLDHINVNVVLLVIVKILQNGVIVIQVSYTILNVYFLL